MLLVALSAFCLSAATAQITITDNTFPSVGDTLKYAVDNGPQGIDLMLAPGGPVLWDFSSLKISQTSQIVYRPASVGVHLSSFPGADMVVVGQTGESYFNKTATKFEFMGYAGGDPAGLGLQVLAKSNPALTERKAPLNFFDIQQQSSNLTLPLSTASLPDTAFGGALAQIDSIRVRIKTQQLEVVDGWGVCKIPGGSYPVLRQKRIVYATTALDVKVPFLGWVDASNFPGVGGALGGFLGTDTTTSYRFLSGTEKEEIAVATMNSALSAAETVRFKNTSGISPAPEALAPGTANIQAYPNPAVEWVRFDCTNLASGDYTLKIFNVIGKTVWKETYPINGSRSIRIELDNFRKGTYLYSLADSKGNIIGTKRLVVLKP